GQLVRARRYAPPALVGRWLRRNRVVMTVAGVLLLALGGSAVVSVRKIVVERNAAVVARRLAEDRENGLVLLHAQRGLPNDPTAALAWLKRYRRGSEQAWLAQAVADEAVARGAAHRVLAFAAAADAFAVSQAAPLAA